MALIDNVQTVNLHGASVSVVGHDQFTTTNNIYQTEERTLAALKPAVRSGYDVPFCMKRTRESVFKKIDLWLHDPDIESTPNIMWISGSPGAGKSALTSTLASELTKQRRLGSFFFFKRGDANLGDPTALWRTIAYDLAAFHPSLKKSVVEFLNRPCFRDADIRLHYECMVEGALMKNREQLSDAPPVIILDALDECGCDDSHSAQRRVLFDTLTRWSRLSKLFKLIITSRVPSSFYDPVACLQITLETGDSVGVETQNDMRVFFEQSLDGIRPSLGLPPDWPGDSAMDQLTKRAAGLFIWAKTAMAFLEEPRGNPTDKLRLILTGNLGEQNESIDSLYRNILNSTFKDSDHTTLELFKAVVGTVIVAKTPLHRDDLEYFLGLQEGEGDRQFNAISFRLSSLIESNQFFRLRHLSFADFLCDPDRCRVRRFVIDPRENHRNLALACLRVMNAELRFNICDLESSYLRNKDVPDLSNRIATCVSTRLLYSCRYWAAHLCETTTDWRECRELLEEVRDFFFVRLLYWLEVMSLIEEVPASSIALLMAARWTEANSRELSDFARDASLFVVNFHIPISESAPHIYLSALPFSPEKSLVSRQFISRFPETMSIVTGRDERWPAVVRVLTGHTSVVRSVAYSPDEQRVAGSADDVICVWDAETSQIAAGPFTGHTETIWSISYSPDGKQIVSGSADETIYVWDAETGQIIAGPFEGHAGSVLSVAYSPDGRHVISGSDDKTACMWDIEMGHVSRIFKGHTASVWSVAYSPDGSHIVSGSADKTLRVWRIDGQIVAASPFNGQAGTIWSVAYSPDGSRIVSGADDNTVCVWDAVTGQIVAGPFKGHTAPVWSVAYSPDGIRVVSGSADKTLRVWDIETNQVAAFKGHAGGIWSVAYSADGSRVVTGSADKTLRVWDLDVCHTATGCFNGHTGSVEAVAYSRDGKRVVSGSGDKTLRVWDVETGEVVAGPFTGHTAPVGLVAYSPDGRRIISGSADKMLCVWDVETGEIAASPFKDSTGSITSIAFSPDGKQVASGSDDKTVCVWDIETGHIPTTPFKGHTASVWSVAYSPDGSHVASGSADKTIRVWHIKSGQTVAAGAFKGHTAPVSSVAYSPDGKRLVSGSADKTLRVWDPETGPLKVGPFIGHTGSVWSVAYSPDGSRVVSGSGDNTLRVWDAETGQVVAGPFRGHTDRVWTVAYSPDGRQVVSGSADKTLCVWDVGTGHDPNNRHLGTLHAVGGPNMFGSRRLWYSNGWTFHSSSMGEQSDVGHHSILFWVPLHARQGLCDIKALLVLGVRRTQLDFSRFVHGTFLNLDGQSQVLAVLLG